MYEILNYLNYSDYDDRQLSNSSRNYQKLTNLHFSQLYKFLKKLFSDCVPNVMNYCVPNVMNYIYDVEYN